MSEQIRQVDLEKKLEPGSAAAFLSSTDRALTSIAISLKRIADEYTGRKSDQ